MRLSIGADPGTTGGIALCSSSGLLEATRVPARHLGRSSSRRLVDARALRAIVWTWSLKHDFAGADRVTAVIEQMQTFAASEKAGQWPLLSMGMSAGIIEGVLAAFSHETLNPPPATWKSTYGLLARRSAVQKAAGIGAETTGERKQRAHRVALMLYPTMGRVPHDVAEAVLIAAWGLSVPLPQVSLDVQRGKQPMATGAEEDPWSRS